MKAVNILSNNQVYFKLMHNVTTSFSTHDIDMSKLEKYTSVTIADEIENDGFLPSTIDKSRNKIWKSTSSLNNADTSMSSEMWWTLNHNNKIKTNISSSYSSKTSKIKIIKLDRKLDRTNHVLDYKKKIVPYCKKIINKSTISESTINVNKTHDKDDTKNKEDITLTTENITSKSNASPVTDIKQTSDVEINNATSPFLSLSTIPFPIYNTHKKLPLVEDTRQILAMSSEEEPETLHYPTISKILTATLSEQSRKALESWKANLIAKMGEDKFNEYNQAQMRDGTLFHSGIENILHGRSSSVPDNVQLAIDSVSSIANELEDIKAIESHVSHKQLLYRGKMDCIAMYRGKLCVVDWKKSHKEKSSLFLTYDAPVQLAAYIGAINYSNLYPFTVDQGLLVVGYTSGKPADAYEVKTNTLVMYWNKWLSKLQQYHSSSTSKSN